MTRPRRRRRRAKILIPVASMGDIAFLLIIFFMVCSNFAREAGIQYVPPTAAGLGKLKQSPIAVAIDTEGAIYLNGALVSDADQVKVGLQALYEKHPGAAQSPVLFRCDRNVDKEVFEPVLDAIAAAGGLIAAFGEQAGP